MIQRRENQQILRKRLDEDTRQHITFTHHSPHGVDKTRRSSKKHLYSNGGVPAARIPMRRSFGKKEKTIIIIRNEFKKLLHHSEREEPLRNQLLIDFPCLMGLRTWEISHLYWQGVNISEGRLTITNSKTKYQYPLPLPFSIAKKLEQYRHGREDGLVIRRLRGSAYSYHKTDESLTNCGIWMTWRRVARRSGIKEWKKFNPRLGRHYFAVMATYHPDPEKRVNLKTLQEILRHKNLDTTQLYLNRLMVFEDIQRDFSRLHNVPQIEGVSKMYVYPESEMGQVELREECLTCPAQSVCKYKEMLARCPVAGPCRRRPMILKLAKTETDPK